MHRERKSTRGWLKLKSESAKSNSDSVEESAEIRNPPNVAILRTGHRSDIGRSVAMSQSQNNKENSSSRWIENCELDDAEERRERDALAYRDTNTEIYE